MSDKDEQLIIKNNVISHNAHLLKIKKKISKINKNINSDEGVIKTGEINVKSGTIDDIESTADPNSIVNKKYVDEHSGGFDPSQQMNLTNEISLTTKGTIKVGVDDEHTNPKTILNSDGTVNTIRIELNNGIVSEVKNEDGDYAIVNKKYVDEHSGQVDPSQTLELTNEKSMTTTGNVLIGYDKINDTQKIKLSKDGDINVIKGFVSTMDDNNLSIVNKVYVDTNINDINDDIYDINTTLNTHTEDINNINAQLSSIGLSYVVSDIKIVENPPYTTDIIFRFYNNKYTLMEWDEDNSCYKAKNVQNGSTCIVKNDASYIKESNIGDVQEWFKNTNNFNDTLYLTTAETSMIATGNVIFGTQSDPLLIIEKNTGNLTSNNGDIQLKQGNINIGEDLNDLNASIYSDGKIFTKDIITSYSNIYVKNSNNTKISLNNDGSIYANEFKTNNTNSFAINDINNVNKTLIQNISNVNTVKLTLNSKEIDDTTKNSDDNTDKIITTKKYVDEQLNTKADSSALNSYYNKTETDTLLNTKLNSSQLETIESGDTNKIYSKDKTDALLSNKADSSALNSYYNKTETDTLLNSKLNLSQLETIESGDTNKIYSKDKTDALLSNKADSSALNSYYNKTETDALLSNKADSSALNSYYNKTETDTLLNTKLNSSQLETIESGDTNKIYSKDKTDALLNTKADSSALNSYYNKTETDTLLNTKLNSSQLETIESGDTNKIYSKDKTDALLSNKVSISPTGNIQSVSYSTMQPSSESNKLNDTSDSIFAKSDNTHENKTILQNISSLSINDKEIIDIQINDSTQTDENDKKITTKKYVDNAISSGISGISSVSLSSGTISGNPVNNTDITNKAYVDESKGNYHVSSIVSSEPANPQTNDIILLDNNNYLTLKIYNGTSWNDYDVAIGSICIVEDKLDIYIRLTDIDNHQVWQYTEINISEVENIVIFRNALIENNDLYTNRTHILYKPIFTINNSKFYVSNNNNYNLYTNKYYKYTPSNDNNRKLYEYNEYIKNDFSKPENLVVNTLYYSEVYLTSDSSFNFIIYTNKMSNIIVRDCIYLYLGYSDSQYKFRECFIDDYDFSFNYEINKKYISYFEISNPAFINHTINKNKIYLCTSANISDNMSFEFTEIEPINKQIVHCLSRGQQLIYYKDSNNDERWTTLGVGKIDENTATGEIFNCDMIYNVNIASGEYSHAEGFNTTASGSYSHAEGFNTTASGESSHVEGNDTSASGNNSHAEGDHTIASGFYSHAEGDHTTASGNESHAEGSNSTASGSSSHAEGNDTTALGNCSHAEGNGTTASSSSSHAEGEYTTALGLFSHAEGNGTTASGSSSHAEGNGTTASGDCSHAEGFCSTASGDCSHAEGTNTTASGNRSHASGYYTTANVNYMTAIGKYNVDNATSNAGKLFVVGNGSSSSRSDAFIVNETGNAIVQNDLKTNTLTLKDDDTNHNNKSVQYITKDINSSASDDNKTLATKAYVDESKGNYHVSSIVSSEPANPQTNDIILLDNNNYLTLKIYNGTSWNDYDVAIGSICIVEDKLDIYIRLTNINNHQVWQYTEINISEVENVTHFYTALVENDDSATDSNYELYKPTISIENSKFYVSNNSNYKINVDNYYKYTPSVNNNRRLYVYSAIKTDFSDPSSLVENKIYYSLVDKNSSSSFNFIIYSTQASTNIRHTYIYLYLGISDSKYKFRECTINEFDFSFNYEINKKYISYNDENNPAFINSSINKNKIYLCSSAVISNSLSFEFTEINPINKQIVHCLKSGQQLIYYKDSNNDERWTTLGVGKIDENTATGEIFNSYSGNERNIASGSYSHAEGYNTTASGSYSHAEGYNTTVSGGFSHAEGYQTTASGFYSHAEGIRTTASGACSHAEGNYTFATTDYSHAEGYNATASGSRSHAEGSDTTASGERSHAEGYHTSASGFRSHAEGGSTTASGSDSHAEGSDTTASGSASHAEGYQTTASGERSHAGGFHTTANVSCMTAIGKYNVDNATSNAGKLFVVGNGTYSSRSDAFIVNELGNAIVQTSLTVNGQPITSNSVNKSLKFNEDTIISACNNNDYIYSLNSIDNKFIIYKYTNIKQQGLFIEINKYEYPDLKQICIFDNYLLLLSNNNIYYIKVSEETNKNQEKLIINNLLQSSNINKIVNHPLNNQFYVLYNSFDYFSIYKLNNNEFIKTDYHVFTQENNYNFQDLNIIDIKFYNDFIYFIHNSYKVNNKYYIIFSNYDESNNSIIKNQSTISFNEEYYIDSLAYNNYIYYLIQNNLNTKIIKFNKNDVSDYKIYEDIINDNIIKCNNNLYNKFNESHFYLVSNNYIYYFNIEDDLILLENKFYAENCKYISSNQIIYITNEGIYNINNDVLINGNILLNGKIKTSTLNTIQLNISDIDVNVNKTIIHNTLIDGNIDNYQIGHPIFIKDNKTYTLQKKSNDGKYPIYEYIKINNNNYMNNTINQIPMITNENNSKFIGVIIAIHPKNIPLKINEITNNYIKINNDTIDFATHGDFIFKVDNNTIEHQTTSGNSKVYEIGDEILYDGRIVDLDQPLTRRTEKMIVGTITYIPENNTDFVSVFKV